MNILRKKLLSMSAIILLMVFFSSIFATSYENIFIGKTKEKVNFRKKADLNYSSIITQVDKNTKLNVIDTVNDFSIVMLPSKEFGLIYTKYIEKNNNEKISDTSFKKITNKKATILNNSTNIRTGPGTNYKKITKVNKNDIVTIKGKISNWYLVLTNNNYVGLIREDLIKLEENSNNKNSNNNKEKNNKTTLPNNEETVLKLINDARKNNGLPLLKIDNLLNSTAKAKALDMVKENYFAHESKTYGSPFNMIQKAGIRYKTAGENIAGNQSVQNAVKEWLDSDIHKQNILSNAYNYIGIGLEKSNTYGYVIVVMFIGK